MHEFIHSGWGDRAFGLTVAAAMVGAVVGPLYMLGVFGQSFAAACEDQASAFCRANTQVAENLSTTPQTYIDTSGDEPEIRPISHIFPKGKDPIDFGLTPPPILIAEEKVLALRHREQEIHNDVVDPPTQPAGNCETRSGSGWGGRGSTVVVCD